MTLRQHLRRHARTRAHALLRTALTFRSRHWQPGRGAALVIAPHPDDETFGCGGLIASKRQAGAEVRVLFLTDGSASHPQHPTLTPAAIAALRREEALAAARHLGLPANALVFLGAPDGSLPHLPVGTAAPLIQRIAEEILALHPEEILLPYRHDGSSEHDAAHQFVRQATDKAGTRARLLEYPVWAWWSPRLLTRPLLRGHRVWRVEFPAHLPAKRAAVACYRSQIIATPPWTSPVLPVGFAARFSTSAEYYFEA